LYRLGNATSARLERIRPDEVVTEMRGGIAWVLGRSGGASTFDAPSGLRGKHWWRLPALTEFDDSRVYLWNDFGNHWSWEPAMDMPLADYLAELSALGGKFTPTP
jgi:hypothetical protein